MIWKYHIENNNCYQLIISLKSKVVPIILEDLKEKPSLIYLALYKLTGENPVKEENAGNVIKSIEDWLEWAKKNNLIT